MQTTMCHSCFPSGAPFPESLGGRKQCQSSTLFVTQRKCRASKMCLCLYGGMYGFIRPLWISPQAHKATERRPPTAGLQKAPTPPPPPNNYKKQASTHPSCRVYTKWIDPQRHDLREVAPLPNRHIL